MLRLYLYARVRTSRALLHTRPRVQQAPGIPCALLTFGAKDFCKPGRNAPREREPNITCRFPPSGASRAMAARVSAGMMDYC